MKRKAGIMLLSLLLLSGCAAKADVSARANPDADLMQVRETLAPAMETYVPEQDTNVVGSVTYYPTMEYQTSAIAGSNCVSLFFQNENVKAESGQIALFEKDTQKKVASLDASDTEHIVVSPLSQAGMAFSGFSSGTQVDLYFDYPFEAGKYYFVLMDPACFSMGRIYSKAVTDAEVINFRTKEYGFFGDMRSIYHVNDFAFFNITLGWGADYAEFSFHYDEISIVNRRITKEDIENGETYAGKPLVTFVQEGTPVMTVSFYKDDVLLDSVDVQFEVVAPEIEIEEVDLPFIAGPEEEKQAEEAIESEEEEG